jgi:LCP family protein required for cell wall assembly
MRFTDLRPRWATSFWGRVSSRASGCLSRSLVWVTLVAASALIAAGLYRLLWPQATPVGVLQAGSHDPLSAVYADAPAVPGPTAAPSPKPSLDPAADDALGPVAVTPPPCVPPVDWGIHVVQPGTTLTSLARRYGTDIDTLMGVNCLNTNTIFVNQRLYVPGAQLGPAVSTPATPLPVTPMAQVAVPEPTPALTPPASVAPAPPPVLAVDLPQNLIHIVLLGSDRRPGSGVWRTDSMIVVSVDPQGGLVRMISIPRDLWVYIPTHGYDRINTADIWGALKGYPGGGPALVKRTIYHNLGIPVHYYVRVDFAGFIQIIDAVGGIDVDVDCPLPDINLSAGVQHMDGQQALRYARSRMSTNDFDRGRRQRKVLSALWEQTLKLDIIPQLPKLWIAMSGAFETDLGLEQILNLAYVGVSLKPQQIRSTAIGAAQVQGWVTSQGAHVLLPRNDRIVALLKQVFAPPEAGGPSLEGQVTVEILNGSPRPSAGELAAAQVGWEGFQVMSTAPAERQDLAQTSILVYRGDTTVGELLAGSLRVPVGRVQHQPDADAAADVRVILGRDYDPCKR